MKKFMPSIHVRVCSTFFFISRTIEYSNYTPSVHGHY